MEEKLSQPTPQQNPQPSSGGGSSGTGLAPNVASLLCYVCTLVTGIIFLVIEKEDKEIKFHAWQAIFLGAVGFVIWLVLFILSFIPVINIIATILGVICGIGLFIIWILAMIQAYKGEHWVIPIIGNLAEQQVNKAS